VGVITNCAEIEAVEEFRKMLANAWCLVVLEVKRQVHRDQDAQDFLLGALPAILVQTIYRLLVDCFPDDKPHFVHHVDALLEKLYHVVSYEVCGFQLNVETGLKERKQLFRKVVLDNPFVNQRDSVKAQMRQELLENQVDHNGPLKFGTSLAEGGQPLEETQLEHVMLSHQEMQTRHDQWQASSKSRSVVPKELNVDRYGSVAMESTHLFNRQLQELMPAQSPPRRSSSRGDSRGASRGGSRGGSKGSRRRSFTDGPEDKRNAGRFKKRAQAVITLSSRHKEMLAEQAEKRRREDVLVKRIVAEPLPPELCERALDTTWVSPITNRLAPGERDRQALGKPSSEAYQLKMALPPVMSVTLRHKSHSTSELRGGSQELPKISNRASLAADTEAQGDTSPSASLKPGQKDCKAIQALHLGGSLKSLRACVAEELILEPPPRLQREVVMNRLEAVGKTFQQNSFGNYIKEFDVINGNKKQSMDDAVMRKAETTYVKSMQELVGPADRPALKMYDSPLQMAKRRLKDPKKMK
jgi:hypothetical protein